MKGKHFGWLSYLALLIGVTVAVDLMFDVVGFSKASVFWVVGFVTLTIVTDFFTGDSPSQAKREEQLDG